MNQMTRQYEEADRVRRHELQVSSRQLQIDQAKAEQEQAKVQQEQVKERQEVAKAEQERAKAEQERAKAQRSGYKLQAVKALATLDEDRLCLIKQIAQLHLSEDVEEFEEDNKMQPMYRDRVRIC